MNELVQCLGIETEEMRGKRLRRLWASPWPLGFVAASTDKGGIALAGVLKAAKSL